VLRSGAHFEPIECISVAGDDLHFWYAGAGKADLPDLPPRTCRRSMRARSSACGAFGSPSSARRVPEARSSSSSCALAAACS
jgi:hypothetical protein